MSPMKDSNLVPRSIVEEADTRDLGTKLKEDKTAVLQCCLCYRYHIDILQNYLREKGLARDFESNFKSFPVFAIDLMRGGNNSWRCFNLERR